MSDDIKIYFGPLPSVNLGYKYEHGIGVEVDYKKALECYKEAADHGDPIGINNYGWMYQTGRGVKKDLNKAAEILLQAAKDGEGIAMLNLGYVYEELGRAAEKKKHLTEAQKYFKQSAEWYKKAKKSGDERALFNFANNFHHGWGVPKNYHKAYSIFKKLAAKGDIGSNFYLGLYYANGYAVEQDYVKARYYYKKAADKDDTFSCMNLGLLYLDGHGGCKSFTKAVRYIRRAAELGDTNAIDFLETPEGLDLLKKEKRIYKRPVCPHCGSKNIARYFYGLPIPDATLLEQVDAGRTILGGCCITDDSPKYHCHDCKKDFGKYND